MADAQAKAEVALAAANDGVDTALSTVEDAAAKVEQVQAVADAVNVDLSKTGIEQVGVVLQNENFAAAREIADTGVVQDVANEVTELVLAPVVRRHRHSNWRP